MSPLLFEGDLVFVHKTKKIRSGDVVFIMTDNGLNVIHRSLFVRNKLITMGDANINIDSFGIKRVVGVAKIKESFFRRTYFIIRMLLVYYKGCFFGK